MQSQSHLQTPDYVMLAGYFLLMLCIGVYFYRRMQGMKDYFTGRNSIPWWISGVSFYMSSFSAMAFVTYPALCYLHGWVGVTALWVAVPATLFSATLFAKRWRRARIDSPVEFIETRYSATLRQLFVWQGIPVKIVNDALRLFATGTFVSVCSGLDIRTSILGAGGVMLLYTFMGGVWAVSVADFIQFIILTAAIFIILPLSIVKAGGLSEILHNSPEGFFRLTAPGAGYDWPYILHLVVLYALAWSSINWPLIQRYYCVATEKDAVKTGWLVVGLYVIGPPLMFFPAIAASHLPFPPEVLADLQTDAGHIYPALCGQLLPAGMLGLAIAAMFAATMSCLGGDYNACASVLTNDIYKRLLRPLASQKELVWAGRCMTLLIGAFGISTAFFLARASKAEGLFRMMVTLFDVATAPVAIPMLLGLISKRVTNRGAITGFVCGTVTGLLLFFLSLYSAELSLPGFAWHPGTKEVVLLGYAMNVEMALFLSTVAVTLVTVFLFGGRADAAQRARVDAFAAKLDTPIGQLPEDVSETKGAIMSPFRVVGVSLAVIACVMLAVVPWVDGALAKGLDAGIGLLLVALGTVMAWRSRAPQDA